MNMLSTYIALGVYVIVLAVLTFLAARRKSGDDFLRASGNMKWGIISLSVFASILSSYNIAVGLTFAYQFGPWVIVTYLGVLLAFIVIYILAKRQNREVVIAQKFNSIVDYFKVKFGRNNASLLNIILIISLFLFIALQFYVNTSVFTEILGWSKYLSAIFVGVVVLLYTLIGGLKVEILTDVFQGILMFLIVGLVFMVDTSHITKDTILPILSNKTVIIGAISLAIVQFLTLLVQPEMWQRVYATKDMRHVKRGFIGAWILLMIVVIPLIVIGLSARATGVQNSGNLFYGVLSTSAPSWFMPFLSVALFAAFMSSLDSSLFAISSQIGKYGFWIKKKETEEKKIISKTRLVTVIVSILALLVSLYFTNFLIHVLQLISLLTVVSVVVLFSIIFKTEKKETFWATIFSFVVFCIMAFTGLITDETHTTLYPCIIVFIFMLIQHLFIKSYKRRKMIHDY